ncbi:MAG: HmuY family protein [Flavobacteriales bacterium]|nr:HmuY family protein [Flavobacteriales bacterium]
MRARVIIPVIGAMLLSGCLKDELPVPARPGGEVVTGQACLGSDYGDQLWYDIGTNSVVTSNSKMDWDLAFECGVDGWRVRLNTSRFMRALATSSTDITQPLDTTGFGTQWRVDHNTGSPDSTAIDDWRIDEPVYALELGFSEIGLPMGVRQLHVTSVDASGYTFEIAQMNGSNVQSFTIAKDPSRSYVHFKISSGQPVTIAPPKGSYDLAFTQYTFQFYEPYTAYLVTGAVNAFSGMRVTEVVNADFDAVNLSDTLAHPFSMDDDAIGYEWKEYDFDLGVYVMHPERVFIVHDAEGLFHKIHFVDFYNDQGERGCPTFEVVTL